MECDLTTVTFAIIGFIVILFHFLDTLWTILQGIRTFLSPYFLGENLSTVQKFGEWAMVTGCTDGIGKEYAKELSRKGHNIVLVSRTEEKLRKTATEIETQFGVKTKIVVADFSKGPEIYAHIRAETQNITIGILVNNVGSQYDYPMKVGQVPEHIVWNIININVGAATLLTRMFIEEMDKAGKGAIVNVSSGSELQPFPLMAIYGASKTYVQYFTNAIKEEYANSNVFIQHLSPMFVKTKMNAFSESLLKSSNPFVPDAETYARNAVSTLGKLSKTTGYWTHGIQYFFGSLPPVWIRTKFCKYMLQGFRSEYLKNQSKC